MSGIHDTEQKLKKAGLGMTKNSSSPRYTGPGVRLWGHRIILSGEALISCEECEMEEEVPELLQMSSGFREVLYKLYILGKFKNTRCDSLNGLPAGEGITDKSGKNGAPPYNRDKVHWSSGSNTYKCNFDDGQVIFGDGTVIKSTSNKFSAGDTLSQHQMTQMFQEQSGKGLR
jgi:hypothetical protein